MRCLILHYWWRVWWPLVGICPVYRVFIIIHFFFVVVVISRFFLFFSSLERRALPDWTVWSLKWRVPRVKCGPCVLVTDENVFCLFTYSCHHIFPTVFFLFGSLPFSLSLSFVRSFYRRTEKSPFGFVLFVVLFSFLFLTSNFFFYFLFLGFFFFFFFVSKPNDDDATWPPVARCPFRLAGEGNRWNLLLFFFPSLISSGTSPLAATEKKNPRNGPKNNGKREILSLPSSSSSSSSSKFETWKNMLCPWDHNNRPVPWSSVLRCQVKVVCVCVSVCVSVCLSVLCVWAVAGAVLEGCLVVPAPGVFVCSDGAAATAAGWVRPTRRMPPADTNKNNNRHHQPLLWRLFLLLLLLFFFFFFFFFFYSFFLVCLTMTGFYFCFFFAALPSAPLRWNSVKNKSRGELWSQFAFRRYSFCSVRETR